MAKADTVQWMAHGPWLQTWVSAVCGQATPPNLGWVTARLRDWKPLAHDLVQVDQAPNDGKTQSTGHLCALQVRASWACGQALPPFVGSVKVRLRDCLPLPHDLVQVDQAVKAPMVQSTAQAALLQTRVSWRYGHT